jgi:hypothetical protein
VSSESSTMPCSNALTTPPFSSTILNAPSMSATSTWRISTRWSAKFRGSLHSVRDGSNLTSSRTVSLCG